MPSINFDHSFWKNKIVLLDSRRLVNPVASIFFAVQGKQTDGHHFIPALYQKGVRHFVVQKNINQQDFPQAHFIQTAQPIELLQAFAQWHRQQYELPVIGITGSNGKTIIKEWLSQILSEHYSLVKSPKSYNSQIGVPLSVLGLNKAHELAIFEAGISTTGEMQRLAPIIQAQIGIFSNIGAAHASGFVSTTEKIREKLQLFQHSELIIFPYKYKEIAEVLRQEHLYEKSISWGADYNADIPIFTENSNGHTKVKLLYQGHNREFRLPLASAASVENALNCLIAALQMGIALDTVITQLQKLKNLPMRLEIKAGKNNCTLVDDSYNNDLLGIEVALNFLNKKQQQEKHKLKTVILSDVLQSDLSQEELYRQLAHLFKQYQIDKFIGIGPAIYQSQDLFYAIPQLQFFRNTRDFEAAVDKTLLFDKECILIKGARSFGFEYIVQLLQKQMHNSVLEINLDALAQNLSVYKGLLRRNTKIMAMVKAFAYGSNNTEVAQLLQYQQVHYLGVAYVDEGVQLRQGGIRLPIMIMNPSADSLPQLLKYELQAAVGNLFILEQMLQELKRQGCSLSIHLEFDTGMNRLGFKAEELPQLLDLLSTHAKEIRVVSSFSHLAAADEEEHNAFSQGQIQRFQTLAQQLETHLGYPVIKHLLNSAGITRFPEAQLDMVRLGIGLYGIDPNAAVQEKLQNIGVLKSRISQINMVKAGESIGYSRKGKVLSDSRIATIAIGYADGYLRAFGNGVGKVLINGQWCPTIGNICMDMCFVDITEVEAQTGDEVVIFNEERSVSDLAQDIGSIPYEILTNISQRIPRIFFES